MTRSFGRRWAAVLLEDLAVGRLVSWPVVSCGRSLGKAWVILPERKCWLTWFATITAMYGKNTAQANSTQRKAPDTKIMPMKQAVRKAMVMVYRRMRDDISSLVAIRASVISGAEPLWPDSATVRVSRAHRRRSVTVSAYACSPTIGVLGSVTP